MANQSIFAAFERMWQHIVTALDKKSNIDDSVLTIEQSLTDEQRAQARANISKYNWKTFSDNYGTYTYAVDNSTIDWDIAQTIKNTSGNGSVSALEDIVSWTVTSFLHPDTITNTNMLRYISSNYDALKNGGATNGQIIVYKQMSATYLSELETAWVILVSHDNTYGGTHCIGLQTPSSISNIFYNLTTDSVVGGSARYQGVQTDLKLSGYAADAKAVGDALALKADKTEIAQSDWSVNDETSLAYVKNRPFYTYEGEAVILPETSYAESDRNGLGSTQFDASSFTIEADKEYAVTFDGETYSCVAYTDSSFPNNVFLGNFTIVEDMVGASGSVNTGEPFILVYDANDGVIIFTPTVDSHTIQITCWGEAVQQIDAKYIPEIPSVGRDGTAEGAEIFNNYEENIASGGYSHAEGYGTVASGWYSHAEGSGTDATGSYSHSEGFATLASNDAAHAEGHHTEAIGQFSHAEGYFTVAASREQHVQGAFNILDTEGSANTRGRYVHIVGNGRYENRKILSNAHTLDWSGNAWYQGDVYVGGTSQDDAVKLIKESEIATDEDITTFISEMGIADPVTTSDGSVYTNADGDIYVL